MQSNAQKNICLILKCLKKNKFLYKTELIPYSKVKWRSNPNIGAVVGLKDKEKIITIKVSKFKKTIKANQSFTDLFFILTVLNA
jgi:hypothetical protein